MSSVESEQSDLHADARSFVGGPKGSLEGFSGAAEQGRVSTATRRCEMKTSSVCRVALRAMGVARSLAVPVPPRGIVPPVSRWQRGRKPAH